MLQYFSTWPMNAPQLCANLQPKPVSMFLIRIFARLPFPLIYALSSLLAWLLDRLLRYRRRVIEDNLRHAFPEKDSAEIKALRRKFYLHFTDLWLEALKGLEMSEKEYRKRVKLLNPEPLFKFLEQGKPVMVLSSHRSGWEWLTPSHSLILQVPIDATYKKVQSEFFEKLMYQIRSRFGARMVEKQELLRDSIRRNHIPRLLAIMSDQSPHKALNSLWISFMNRPAPFYNASEKLARKLKMPVVYADMQRVSRGHYEVVFRLVTDNPDAMPENKITETYVHLIEEGIKKAPADYLWSHRRWKHQPPKDWQS